jgi:GxxExxY protein
MARAYESSGVARRQPQIPQMRADQAGDRSHRSGWPGFAHTDLTESVIGCFYEVYNELGGGFLESVYRDALEIVFQARRVTVTREPLLTVSFRGREIGRFRVDFIADGRVAVEVKAVPALQDAHVTQVINYLRAGRLEVGLLLNFGPQPSVRRLVCSASRR